MARRFRALFLAVLLAYAALAAVVCAAESQSPVSVTVSPAARTIAGRASAVFSALVAPESASQSVTWTLYDAAHAVVDENNPALWGETLPNGAFRVTGKGDASLPDARFTVEATAVGASVTGTAALLLTRQAVEDVKAPSELTVAVGETVVLEACVLPRTASERDMVLATDAQGFASVPGNGVQSAPDADGLCTWRLTGVAVGTYTARVTAKDGGMGRKVTVNVVEPSPVAPMPQASKPDGTVFTADAARVRLFCAAPIGKAYVTYSTDFGRHWIDLDTDALVQAGVPLPNNQRTTILAKTVAIPGRGYEADSETASLTYESAIPVARITLAAAGAPLDLETGVRLSGTESVELSAEAVGLCADRSTPIPPKDAAVVFASSNRDVVAVVQKGNDKTRSLAALQAVAPGNARITAVSADGKATVSFTVRVEPVPAARVLLYQNGSPLAANTLSLNVGECKTLQAKVLDATGRVAATEQRVVWTISDGRVATLQSGKLVGLMPGGTARVKAYAVGNPDAFASVDLIVGDEAPVRVAQPTVAVLPGVANADGAYAEAQILIAHCATDGATLYYTVNGATPTPADEVFPADGLELSGPAVATVRVAAYKGGLEPSAALSRTLKFAIPVSSVELVGMATVSMKQTLQLPASVYPDAATDARLLWGIDYPTDAHVSAGDATIDGLTGLITPVKPGVVLVTARALDGLGAPTAVCVLTITKPPLTSLVLLPDELTLNTLDVQQLVYRAERADKSDKGLWQSSDSSIVAVSQTGLVTAKAPGTAWVTLDLAGKTASACVTVLPDPQLIPCKPEAPGFTPTSTAFTARAGASLGAQLGVITPADGQTLEQLFYYYGVTVQSEALSALDEGVSFSIDRSGRVFANIPNVGEQTCLFDYQISLAGKPGRATDTLRLVRQTGNTLTIQQKPSYTLNATDKAIGDWPVYRDEQSGVCIATVDNMAELLAAQIEVTADAQVVVETDALDAHQTPWIAASVSQTGDVLLNYVMLPIGTYTVTVTVKATGLSGVSLLPIRVISTDRHTPKSRIELPEDFPQELEASGTVRVARGETTATLSSGIADGWTSADPRIAVIDAVTGRVRFKRLGTTVLRCTLHDNSRASLRVKVVEPAQTFALQYRVQTSAKRAKWVAVKPGQQIRLIEDDSLTVRAVPLTPKRAKTQTITFTPEDASLLTAVSHGERTAVLYGNAPGETTLTLTNAFGGRCAVSVRIERLSDAKSAESKADLSVKGSMREVD